MRILVVLAAVLVLGADALAQTPPSAQPSSGTPDGVRVSEVTGKPVRNAQGERLGTVEDLVITADDRTVLAVVALGSFPGASSGRLVAVPFRNLAPSRDGYVLDVTAEQLKAYPDYKWPAGGREDYTAQGRARMSEWEAKVGEFAADAKRKTEAGAAEASARISSAWGKVKEQWTSLSEATGEKWDAAKRSFEQSWQDFQREWNRTTTK